MTEGATFSVVAPFYRVVGTAARPDRRETQMRDDLSPRRRALREVALAPALFVVLAAVVLVSLLVGVGPAGSSALSVKNGKFAFVGSSPANIWVMNANGSGRKVLTPHYRFASIERADSEPDWSPNGTEIAFTRSR